MCKLCGFCYFAPLCQLIQHNMNMPVTVQRLAHTFLLRRLALKTRYVRYSFDSTAENTNIVDNTEHITSADGSLEYSVSKADFKWVERLFPPSRIPFPPQHESYPTPSGWVAPSSTVPDKPYFIRRNKYHVFTIFEEKKPKNSQRWLTYVKHIEGDIKALEKELIEALRPYEKFDPATRVNEATQTIWVKGMHKDIIERYLYNQGF